jgi:cell division protein FtsB
MPPARSASATHRRPRQTRPAPRPRRLVSRGAQRVRWDRLGRVGLLVVLVVVAGVYVQDALSYFSARAQADQQAAIVKRLTRENAQLAREQKSLNDPVTIVRDARALGMVRQGERPYVVTGLPNR